MREILLGVPEPTYLPEDHPDVIARADIAAGRSAAEAAAAMPASSYAWAVLAREALAKEEAVAAYAYARTGYHRGLDALRGAGWKGHGPIPAPRRARAEPGLPDGPGGPGRCGRLDR